MNSYRFILEDYHAVKNADIILDGLTVLAGLNGCGKSTISRWLYGFIKYSNDFDRIVDLETAKAIFERTVRLSEILRRIAFINKGHGLPSVPKFSGSLDSEVASFEDRLYEITQSNPDKGREDEYVAMMSNLLRQGGYVRDDGASFSENMSSFLDDEESFLAKILMDGEKRKQESSIPDLYRMIEQGLDIKSKGPVHMQFSENGTDLLDHDYEYIEVEDGVRLVDDDGKCIVTDKILGRFLAPMGLKRALYVDSPMSVSNQDGEAGNVWTDLRVMLRTPLKEMPEAARRIAMEISLILGGEVMLQDEGLGRKDLRYVRRADGLNISIDEVATGMKSFAYLLRLLQNGYIDSETLLIIDEPEAHLHPQWIVKFAKVLVLIQKFLGAKVMVASHDPDMVAAISAMAEAEGLSDVTNFYQASKAPGELRYCFDNSGNDISRIFESFNIALDGIDSYKASDFS